MNYQEERGLENSEGRELDLMRSRRGEMKRRNLKDQDPNVRGRVVD